MPRGRLVALGARLGAGGRPRERSPAASPQGAAGGDILLLHDSDAYSARGSWQRTAAALPAIAAALRAGGLATVTVTSGLTA